MRQLKAKVQRDATCQVLHAIVLIMSSEPERNEAGEQSAQVYTHQPDFPSHKSIGLATPSARNGISILRPCPAEA